MQQNIISVSLIDTTRNNPTPEFFAITTKEKLEDDIKNYMLFNQHQGPILFVTIDKNAQSSTYKATTTEHLYLYDQQIDQQITQYPSGDFDFITTAFNLILHNNYKDISLSCQNESLTLTASINNLYEDEDLADHINHLLNHLHKTKQKIKFNVINHPQENNPLQIEKRLLITKTTTVDIEQL